MKYLLIVTVIALSLFGDNRYYNQSERDYNRYNSSYTVYDNGKEYTKDVYVDIGHKQRNEWSKNDLREYNRCVNSNYQINYDIIVDCAKKVERKRVLHRGKIYHKSYKTIEVEGGYVISKHKRQNLVMKRYNISKNGITKVYLEGDKGYKKPIFIKKLSNDQYEIWVEEEYKVRVRKNKHNMLYISALKYKYKNRIFKLQLKLR